MEGTFKCISGTGRYEGIECSGTTMWLYTN